ncbi:hypothetical protein G9A89_017805 [Geosiphon pyriformis]|nr:hypothetical protein G9A89_017805 [Geosiphon pyriformis]
MFSKRHHVTTACLNCRERKAKCTGKPHCQRCFKNKLQCIFVQPCKKRGPPKVKHGNEFIESARTRAQRIARSLTLPSLSEVSWSSQNEFFMDSRGSYFSKLNTSDQIPRFPPLSNDILSSAETKNPVLRNNEFQSRASSIESLNKFNESLRYQDSFDIFLDSDFDNHTLSNQQSEFSQSFPHSVYLPIPTKILDSKHVELQSTAKYLSNDTGLRHDCSVNFDTFSSPSQSPVSPVDHCLQSPSNAQISRPLSQSPQSKFNWNLPSFGQNYKKVEGQQQNWPCCGPNEYENLSNTFVFAPIWRPKEKF